MNDLVMSIDTVLTTPDYDSDGFRALLEREELTILPFLGERMTKLGFKREHPHYFRVIEDLDGVFSTKTGGEEALDTFCLYLEEHLPVASDEEVLAFVQPRMNAFAAQRLRELKGHVEAYADNPTDVERERLQEFLKDYLSNPT